MFNNQIKNKKTSYIEVVREEFAQELFHIFMNDSEGTLQFSFLNEKWTLTFSFPLGTIKATSTKLHNAVISLYSLYLAKLRENAMAQRASLSNF